jgi:hypothetical protein
MEPSVNRYVIVLQVNTYSTSPQAGRPDLAMLGKGKLVIGMADPLGAP